MLNKNKTWQRTPVLQTLYIWLKNPQIPIIFAGQAFNQELLKKENIVSFHTSVTSSTQRQMINSCKCKLALWDK